MTRGQKWVLVAGLLCAIFTKCAENLKANGLVIHVEIAPMQVQKAEPVEIDEQSEVEHAVVSF